MFPRHDSSSRAYSEFKKRRLTVEEYLSVFNHSPEDLKALENHKLKRMNDTVWC
jgi:hypothetical protein